MADSMKDFTSIRDIQEELSRLNKSPSQQKKFSQFQMNFENVSSEFKEMLEMYQKKNQRLNSQDFQESGFR
jgi:phage-related tail protein